MPTYGLYLSTLVREFSGIYVRKLSIFIKFIINSLRLHSKSHQKSLFLEVFGLVGKNNFTQLSHIDSNKFMN